MKEFRLYRYLNEEIHGLVIGNVEQLEIISESTDVYITFKITTNTDEINTIMLKKDNLIEFSLL